MNSEATLSTETLSEHIAQLTAALAAPLEGYTSLASLEAAQQSYDDASALLTGQAVPVKAMEALDRIEQFIAENALALYRDPRLVEHQSYMIKRFARALLALDGIGPATAAQLFNAGIAHPNQLFALHANDVDALPLPAASHARVAALYKQHTEHS